MYGYGYRYNSGLVVGAGGGAPFTNTYSTQFDGVDAYINCGNPTDLQITGAFTLSVWTKLDSSVVGQTCIISKDNGTSERAFTLWSKIVDKPVFYIWNGATSYNVGGTTNIADDMWHHVAVVYVPSTSIRIYVDGVLEGTNMTSIPASINNANYDFKIGHFAGSLFDFKGLMDEVSVFNSAVDIADLWDGSGQPTDLSLLPTPPIAWYRMGENGVYKSPQWLLPSNENKDKVSNYSFEFDGVDDKVELGAQSLGITGAISVSAWVKIPTTNTGGGGTNIQEIVCEDRTSGTNRNWTLYWRGGGLNQIAGVIWDSAGSAVAVTTNAIVPNDNQWHHVMFTYTGDTSTDGLKLFVDGIQRAQGTSANGGTRATTAVVPTIGGLSQSITWMFEGNIDEVSVFNSDQSANIATLYNSGTPTTLPSGAVAHYKMGEEATFSGGLWTVPDAIGSNDGTSNAMTIEDRVGDAPNSENNALSYNMDEVDRVTDTP